MGENAEVIGDVEEGIIEEMDYFCIDLKLFANKRSIIRDKILGSSLAAKVD